MNKAVVLLSGGLDSTTCLAIARAEGFLCYALSFDYGQRHEQELTAAKYNAAAMQAHEHRIVRLDIGQFGASALTDLSLCVPPHELNQGIPITYVPARNTVFLSVALSLAEAIGAWDIFIGVNAVDYSGYPDCRPQFIQAFQELAQVATKAGVTGQQITIHAPLLHLTKAEIIQKGVRLGIDYSKTISCYQADAKGNACGHCDSCVLRAEGFAAASLQDPTHYVD